jgi:hypothetical protein
MAFASAKELPDEAQDGIAEFVLTFIANKQASPDTPRDADE